VPPVTVALPAPQLAKPRFDYPPARRTSDADVMHGKRVADPYRWLEVESEETKQWFEAEDQRARREIAKLDTKPLIQEMSALYRDGLPRVPTKRGAVSFVQKGGTLHALTGEQDKLLFTADGAAFERITGFVPSRDGAYVAIELSKNGLDMGTARIVETKTARALEEIERLEDAAIVWKDKGFFYAFTAPGEHAERFGRREIRFHAVGTEQATDRIVVPATHDKNATSETNPLAVTKDGTRLLVQTFGDWSRSTFALVDLTRPSWLVTPLVAHTDSPVIVENTVFAIVRDATNGIVRFKPGTAEPETLAPAPPELLELDVQGTTLVAKRAARIGEAATGFVHRDLYDASFKKLSSVSTPRGASDSFFAYPDTSTILVTREGLGKPAHRMELDPKTGTTKVVVPSKLAWDESAYTLDLLEATSKDSTKIPITVLRRKDTPVDGGASLAVYGYGGFRSNAEQIFYPPWMAWAAGKGRVFASCHIRGGLEFGEAWHEAGARRNRQRTIEDFHACIEELHRRHYATPAHTMTQGWSHGGILVTAAAEQRPDLQRVVLAFAPLEDMIRFPLFGRGGVSEYGDPENAGDFEALAGFSPLQNVVEGARYPAFFVTAPSADERVHPMHPRKIVAALQHASTGREILLKVLWGAGHKGGAKDDANATLMEGFAFALAEMAKD